MEVQVTHEILDEGMAVELLKHNYGNRPPKKHAIEKYVRSMLAGRWKFTAEPIKLDASGNLLDGQNRCLALIEANNRSEVPITIEVLVVRGLHPDSQDEMDSGSGRSVSDQLARRGATDYARTAAAIRTILAVKSGNLPEAGHTPDIARSEMIRFYDDNWMAMTRIAETTPKHSDTSGLTPASTMAARFLIEEASVDSIAVSRFFQQLHSGAGLSEGDPILALRSRMQQARVGRERIVNHVQVLLVLRVWNTWRSGGTMVKLPIRTRNQLTMAGRIRP